VTCLQSGPGPHAETHKQLSMCFFTQCPPAFETFCPVTEGLHSELSCCCVKRLMSCLCLCPSIIKWTKWLCKSSFLPRKGHGTDLSIQMLQMFCLALSMLCDHIWSLTLCTQGHWWHSGHHLSTWIYGWNCAWDKLLHPTCNVCASSSSSYCTMYDWCAPNISNWCTLHCWFECNVAI